MASLLKKAFGLSGVDGNPSNQPPLHGLRVVEFAGLAPGPLVGLILADFGADVIRIDKVGASINPDGLARGKRSISVDPKTADGLETLRRLVKKADVVIDPFRPGVLERLGLGPEEAARSNERIIFARLTGFQRQGPYANMAGHDINYIALSGLLSMLGSSGGAPQPPVNILGDFAGGSLICVLGILLALVERARSGKGQVVEADMVTGARYVSTFLLLSSYLEHPEWGRILGDGTNETRGSGMLDGGAPWYGVYRTKDDGWMSVGAIEPQFYAELLRLLKESSSREAGLQHPSAKKQHDKSLWPSLREYFTLAFASKTRAEWEKIFLGTDACCVPVLTRDEAAVSGITPALSREAIVEDGDTAVPSPAPVLTRTPARVAAGSPHAAPDADGYEPLLTPGEHSLAVLREWLGTSDDEARKLARNRSVGGGELDDLEPEATAGKAKL